MHPEVASHVLVQVLAAAHWRLRGGHAACTYPDGHGSSGQCRQLLERSVWSTLRVSYECNAFLTSCKWYTKVQLRNNGGRIMDVITNTTNIYANGISAKVTISKDQPLAVITANQKHIGQVRWTKRVSNLVELSGQARPSGLTTVGITVESCVTGDGPGKSNGAVTPKCAKIGLW